MKHKITNRPPDAFTLIEMLVVISIIGVLAALLFPVAGSIRKNATIKRAKTELSQLETGIENYKLKLGFYPPDNPSRPARNQLYFELLGTMVQKQEPGVPAMTLDGSGQILSGLVLPTFGRNAFSNSNLDDLKGAEEGLIAENFLKATIKPSQLGELSPGVKVFVGPVPWPENRLPWPTSVKGLNPWRYVSSNPTNNTKSYDLWVDLVISGKIHRISNWRKEPEIF